MIQPVLFIQGAGEGAHDRWDDTLVERLEHDLGEGYAVHYPRMPNESDPRYRAWKIALMRELDALEDGAMVVGHSVGGAILIHALAEQAPPLGGIFLIAAPFIGEGGWPGDDIEPREDFAERLPAGVPVFLYHGTADETVPVAHVHLYAKAIPGAAVRRLEHRDHQLNNAMSAVAADIAALVHRLHRR